MTPRASARGTLSRGPCCALLALCCNVLWSCVGEPGELFPALPIVEPADMQSAEPSAPSPPLPVAVAPLEAAAGDVPPPPVTLDVGSGNPGAGAGAEGPQSGDALPSDDTTSSDDTPSDGTPSDGATPGDDTTPPATEAAADDEPAPAADDEGQPAAKLCASIDNALLLDFADPGSAQQALFGDFLGVLSGGTYVYPEAPLDGAGAVLARGLLSDVTAGDWHISGTVEQQSGFGLFLDCQLLDASRFDGIAFRIAGDLDGRESITLLVGTAANEVSNSWRTANGGTSVPSFGRCTPAQSEFDGTCQQARIEVPVSASSREVFVPFSQLQSGSPELGVDPTEITTIGWALPNAAVDAVGRVAPFAVDLRIDDIRFAEATLARRGGGARAAR